MDAKKGKTRKESTPIKVWVTPEEKAAIAAKADAHSLSASSYLRRLGLAMPLQSTIDQRAILDLVKINADLGRFGGLIKMWLTTNADFESLSAQGLQRKLENTLSDDGLKRRIESARASALPRSALGKACDYALGRWGQLSVCHTINVSILVQN